MDKRMILVSVILILSGYFADAQTTLTVKKDQLSNVQKNLKSQQYLSLTFKKGDKFGNVYSRTIAFSGDSLKPLVFRVSGSSSYNIAEPDTIAPVVTGMDTYDGFKTSAYTVTMRLNGISSSKGKNFFNTSASGLLYNEMIWGKAPVLLQEGDSWKVNITTP